MTDVVARSGSPAPLSSRSARFRKHYVILPLAVAGIAAAGGAMSQESGEAVLLPEVNVTGRALTATDPVEGYVADVQRTGTKTDTPLIETPQSVSVITRDEFEARAAQNLNQVLRYTAGVAPDQRGATAVRLDQFSIRGYSVDRYLDGLRLQGGRDANPSVDPYRLERVEVLRGPSSVLYGQTAPGGLVNLTSKRPTETPFRELLLQGGTYDTFRVGGDFSGKLDESGQWLGRFTGSYYRSDTQLDRNKEDHWFVQPSVTWRPTAQTSLTLLGYYQRDPNSGSYGSQPAYGTLLPNPLGRVRRSFYDGDPSYERSDREHWAVGWDFRHQLDEVFTFRQNARYLHSHGEYRSLYNASQRNYFTMNRSVIGVDADVDAFTLDNQLQARFDTGPLRHTVLAGFDYQRTLNDNYSYFGTGPTQNIFQPTYFTQPLAYLPFTSYASSSQNQYGAYLQDQVQYGNFHLLLGGRYDWAHSHGETTTLATRRTTLSDRNDTKFTGRAALLYRFDFGLSPYVSYSESFQPSTGTTAPLRGAQLFEPTTGKQYEVGLRYQPTFMNALFSFSAFDLTQDNVTTADPLYTGFNIQQGRVKSRGFELEAKAELLPGLNLIANYGYLHARRRRNNDTETVNYGLTGVPNGPTVALNGKQPYGIPAHTASAWLDYTFQEGVPVSGLGLAAGVRYVGGSFADNANTLKVSGYTLFDLSARYDLGQLSQELKGLNAQVNVQNVADKRYLTSCYNYIWCWYGNGRTVLGTLRYNF